MGSYKLGEIYQKGKVVPKDENKSLQYYELADQRGHLKASYRIAQFYYLRDKIKNKEKEEKKEEKNIILKNLQKSRYKKGICLLGFFYFKGFYVAKDLQVSFDLLQRASQLNDGRGCYLFSKFYENGFFFIFKFFFFLIFILFFIFY